MGKDKYAREEKQDLRQKLLDPNFLPSREQIKHAFENQRQWYEYLYCRRNNETFEFLNKEYLEKLAQYISDRINIWQDQRQDNIIVLEIGAGNGRLSHFLRELIKKQNIDIIATDSGLDKQTVHFPVTKINYLKALKKFNPDLVINSWMPSHQDFTTAIRQTKCVKEYILIGDKHWCGDYYETWGEEKNIPLKYQEDNFTKHILTELCQLQICRTDIYGTYNRSQTVSFRRKIEKE